MTIFVAFIVKFEINFPHLLANFVPMQFWRALITYSSFVMSIGFEMSEITFFANYNAL